MALDHAGLFTIIGKYVKAINLWDGYISAIETSKTEIRDAYEAEDLHDLYATVPGLIAGLQGNISSGIFAAISDLNNLFLDRNYVIEQLGLRNFSVNDVLNSLFDYMADGSVSIETSVVSINATDADHAATGGMANEPHEPSLFCGRKLDGVQSPGNGVAANIRYSNIESQLARTTTVYAEVLTDEESQEQVQLYSLAQATGGYQVQDEEPGPGPVLINPEAQNLIPSNYDFSSFSSNSPVGWTMSGGSAGTDWTDNSGTGAGPLQINTTNVKAYQQVPALERHRTYFAAALASSSDGNGSTLGLRIRTNGGTTLITQRTQVISTNGSTTEGYGIVYMFFVLGDTVDLSDVYVELEQTAEDSAGLNLLVHKAVVAPAQYYNALAWAWWAPMPTFDGSDLVAVGDRISMAVSNNNNGVFQTFFRKGFNYQLPTADSPSIDDALAV